ncbi:MAG: sigma-70 family RNA polymerase sigma factor [Gemmatimonadales bacterium]|jgi:RNA polymerase sigma factor (TIGR02999 family)|nr:sigma-70 family RNA polymerase sigma factor [Gemmatimonadales bacterium]
MQVHPAMGDVTMVHAPDAPEVTGLLLEAGHGNREALDRLLPLVYDELRALAHARLRGERPDHTLDTTSLAHEAWLKLVDQTRVAWQNRAHFFAVAARAMRRILVNHAEARRTARRGGGAVHVALDDGVDAAAAQRDDELLALDEALTRLATFNERGARVVEYHFFGGLTWEEIAETMELSPVTVRRAWAAARGWLRRELGEARGADEAP